MQHKYFISKNNVAIHTLTIIVHLTDEQFKSFQEDNSEFKDIDTKEGLKYAVKRMKNDLKTKILRGTITYKKREKQYGNN